MTYFELAEYKLFKKLGEGGFGKVYLATYLEGPEEYFAVKILSSQSSSELAKEVKPFAGLEHPSIVKIHKYGVKEQMVKKPSD